MKFGMSSEEAANQPESGGGGQHRWMKYLKDGDNKLRLLQDPKEWVWFWEHYNPGSRRSFPCTRDRSTCPGCTSDNEKMQSASYRAAFNVLDGEFVNAFKVPKTVAEKLQMRYERLGTLTDRDYTITRYRSGGDKVEFDVEAEMPSAVDTEALRDKFLDVEELLVESYEEAWGDSSKVKASTEALKDKESQDSLKAKLERSRAESQKEAPKSPPSEPEAKQESQAEGDGETMVSEADLRAMTFVELDEFLTGEEINLPEDVAKTKNVDKIVDWLLENLS